MSRKARKKNEVRIDSGLGPGVAPGAPFPASSTQKRELVATDPERVMRLSKFQPRLPTAMVNEVRDAVITLVMRVPFGTVRTDNVLIGVGFQYAVACVKQRGGFDPFRDLRDDLITEWAYRRGDKDATAATKLSTLRRLRDAPEKRPSKGNRSIASAPYTPAEWDRLWEAVRESDVRGAAMTVALIGRLGLRPGEVTRADNYSILEVAGGLALHAYEQSGVMRVVPVDPTTAELLRPFLEGEPRFLVRPTVGRYTNLVYHVLHELRHSSPQFAHVDSHRLRHTAVVRWLQQPIPYPVVCAAMGIGASSRLPSDLMPYVPVPNEGTVLRSFREWTGAFQ